MPIKSGLARVLADGPVPQHLQCGSVRKVKKEWTLLVGDTEFQNDIENSPVKRRKNIRFVHK